MGKAIVWSFKKLVYVIVRTLLNDFDFFIVIEGNRGLGKSTLAINLARAVKNVFKKLGNPEFKYQSFTLRRGLIYTQKDMKKHLHKWNSIGIADEMINVTFNRDFFSEDQKDIIKMINMNRDHHNLTIACVPRFKTLDSQIKNLCKMRLTVERRGLAVIQTPNRTIYAKDVWDEVMNEKIERRWLEGKTKKPQYSKLTTFRGLVKFPKLSERLEVLYKEIKELRRNVIAKEDMGIVEDEDKRDVLMETFDRLITGRIKNMDTLTGIAQASKLTVLSFIQRLRDLLKESGRPTILKEYFWEKRAKGVAQAVKLKVNVDKPPKELIEDVDFS